MTQQKIEKLRLLNDQKNTLKQGAFIVIIDTPD